MFPGCVGNIRNKNSASEFFQSPVLFRREFSLSFLPVVMQTGHLSFADYLSALRLSFSFFWISDVMPDHFPVKVPGAKNPRRFFSAIYLGD